MSEQEANFLSLVPLSLELGDRFLLQVLYESHVDIIFICLPPLHDWCCDKEEILILLIYSIGRVIPL